VVIEPAPGGDFGMALLPVPPTSSGLAIGSLVAGIASILVSVAVFCFGISAKPLVALAFGLLAGFIGAAGLVLGMLGVRQVKAAPAEVSGRGLAIAGVSCGATGLGTTVLFLLIALAAGV